MSKSKRKKRPKGFERSGKEKRKKKKETNRRPAYFGTKKKFVTVKSTGR
jgi:hypothetical protein